MTDAADILAQRRGLSALADMANAMAEACFERHEAASDPDARERAIAAFEICARSVRLSILCSVRLSAATRAAVSAANDQRPLAQHTDADRDRDRDLAPDREHDRERERETDGHPMTALGRAEALEAALPRNPDLDPDGRFTAQIINIKARLQGAPPPEPSPPLSAYPDIPPGLLNRADRRRLERRKRRASG